MHEAGGHLVTPLEHARAYIAAGICVIPIRRDGSKAPAVSSWKRFETELPTDVELLQWFGCKTPSGMATLGGAISGGLEVLDFDQEADRIWPEFLALVEGHAPGLMQRLSVVQSPTGGYHARYLCTETAIPGNTKLA